MNSTIILGHPFAGSLYKFFEEQLSDYPHKEPIQHPYYRDLFGRDYIYWSGLAFTLLAMYDKVIVPPADTFIPDHHKYLTERIYDNTELGLYFNWNDFVNDEIHEQVKKDIEDPYLLNLLKTYPQEERKGILEYVRLYIKLSHKYNSPVLCGGKYQNIFSHLLNKTSPNALNNKNNIVSFTDMYLKFLAPLFEVSSLDAL